MRQYIATVPDGLGWDEVVSLAYDSGATITWTYIDVRDVLRVWLEVSDDRADDLVDGCGRLSMTLEERP